MLVSEFLTQVNYALRGTDDSVPTFGTDDANYWVATLNRKKNELYRNSKVLWDETFLTSPPNEVGTVATAGTTTLTGTNTRFLDYAIGDKITVSGETERTIATISSNISLTVTSAFSTTASSLAFTRKIIIEDGVSEYNVSRKLIAPANRAYILKTNGTKTYLDYVQPRESITSTRYVYLYGVNPTTLNFTNDIASTEDIVGGTLFVPGYYMPDDVALETDELPLSDPYWGVMATASEIAFNDITYEDKAQDLNAKANALYMQMVRANRRNTYNQPNKIPSNVRRIRSTEVN